MTYFKLVFFGAFLPVTMILYQLMVKKYRWVILLLSSLVFFLTFGRKVIVYLILAAGITYGIGRLLESIDAKSKQLVKDLKKSDASSEEIRAEKSKIKSKYKRRGRAALVLGIIAVLSMLLYLKYYNFFIENINALLSGEHFALRNLVMPIGISFYSMQAIGYMADVYWGKVKAEKNPFKMLLFLSFFPTLMEGPIAPYVEIKDALYAGESIIPENIIRGYIRLFWGILKKLVIADRLFPAVNALFDTGTERKGLEIVAATVLFTVMEYMDFSGCMDMVLGFGTVFGVTLPENFRQPFFARNASEFWRRWHISLGVWFKTYIFYPVSMSGLVKKWNKFAKDRFGKHLTRVVASSFALLPVWISNGLWHGPKWTYIFYGVFYFVMIMLELIFEPVGDAILAKLKLTKENKVVDFIRILRTWIVIFMGELFFRADTLKDGFKMFANMWKGGSLGVITEKGFLSWGVDAADWIVILISLLVVIVVNVLKERGVDVMSRLLAKPMPVRLAVSFTLVVVLIIFGLYGPGYQEVDLIYAGF